MRKSHVVTLRPFQSFFFHLFQSTLSLLFSLSVDLSFSGAFFRTNFCLFVAFSNIFAFNRVALHTNATKSRFYLLTCSPLRSFDLILLFLPLALSISFSTKLVFCVTESSQAANGCGICTIKMKRCQRFYVQYSSKTLLLLTLLGLGIVHSSISFL